MRRPRARRAPFASQQHEALRKELRVRSDRSLSPDVPLFFVTYLSHFLSSGSFETPLLPRCLLKRRLQIGKEDLGKDVFFKVMRGWAFSVFPKAVETTPRLLSKFVSHSGIHDQAPKRLFFPNEKDRGTGNKPSVIVLSRTT